MQNFDRVKDYLLNQYEKNPVVTTFIGLLLAILVISIIVGIITGGRSFAYTLLQDSHDTFMDHFKSVVTAADGPYTKHTSSYPPLITLVYWGYDIFSEPFTTDFNPSYPHAFNMRDSQIPMMYFVITIMVVMAAFYHVLEKFCEDRISRNQFKLIFILILLSYPVIYGLERGNCTFLAVLFSILYLCGYKSENKYIRIASYVCLGIAAGVRILPAILGILTLKNKGIKEFAYCVVIVTVLLIGPFIFTDGNIFMILDYALDYMEKIAGRDGLINITDFAAMFGLTGSAVIAIAVMVMFALIGLVVFDKNMEEWQAITILCTLVIICFSFTAPYMYLYMIIPTYYFLTREREDTTINLIATVCFAMIFALLPAFSYDHGILVTIKSLALIILLVMLIGLSLKKILSRPKEGKPKKTVQKKVESKNTKLKSSRNKVPEKKKRSTRS